MRTRLARQILRRQAAAAVAGAELHEQDLLGFGGARQQWLQVLRAADVPTDTVEEELSSSVGLLHVAGFSRLDGSDVLG